MKGISGLRSLAGLMLLAALCSHGVETRPAAAQGGGNDQRITFDIPAQPLDSALAHYFRITGVQLLYDSALTRGRAAGAVHGNYAPREALRLLLRGTGLIARYTRSNAAILTTAETTESVPLVPLGRVVVREQLPPPPLSRIERMAFYARLEDEILAHLRTDKRTERLTLDILVALRISRSGELLDLQVARSSGDARADRLVAQVLLGRSVSSPPEGMAQPLLISLKLRRGD